MECCPRRQSTILPKVIHLNWLMRKQRPIASSWDSSEEPSQFSMWLAESSIVPYWGSTSSSLHSYLPHFLTGVPASGTTQLSQSVPWDPNLTQVVLAASVIVGVAVFDFACFSNHEQIRNSRVLTSRINLHCILSFQGVSSRIGLQPSGWGFH